MPDMTDVFSRVRRRWLAAPLKPSESFAGTVEQYLALQGQLRDDDLLGALTLDLYPELAGLPQGEGEDTRAHELHMVNQMLQIMESVWLTVRSDRSQVNLLTRGWMNLFRRWCGSPIFRRHWMMLRGEYSQDFLRFCEFELNLPAGRPRAVPLSRAVLEDPVVVRDLLLLRRDFAGEWPSEEDLGARAARALERGSNPGWLLVLDPVAGRERLASPWPSDAIVCGIILMEPWAKVPRTFEFFVWVRGTYRNLSIGRACAGLVLDEIWQSLEDFWPNENYALRVRYPGGGDRIVSESVRVRMWLNFFHHYDFRKISQLGPRQEQIAPEGLPRGEDLILERDAREIHRRKVARWPGNA